MTIFPSHIRLQNPIKFHLMAKLTLYANEVITGDYQCEFWCNMSTYGHIFYIREILEKKEKIIQRSISSLLTLRKHMIPLKEKYRSKFKWNN